MELAICIIGTERPSSWFKAKGLQSLQPVANNSEKVDDRELKIALAKEKANAKGKAVPAKDKPDEAIDLEDKLIKGSLNST